ncbi:potassium channel family protein [Algicola sagamiensis]|uniref:potassium channel family protein n=1 Tax=Algicola sagamiensis TaxID=163869 RepID=UPI00036A8F77|nr:potassium channel family protein [Algicola sagamiensis]
MILNQLLIGSVVIAGTIFIQAGFISSMIAFLKSIRKWLAKPPHEFKTIIILTLAVLWLVAGMSLSAWLWAAVYLVADVFSSLEPALYFALVTFTTLGYGDIILDENWRLLGGLTAVNGLIIVGLNTAVLVESINQIRADQLGKEDA